MAKISAHGETLATVSFLTFTKRYMSDGTILKNAGFGWKLAGKVKAGVSPEQAARHATDRLGAQLAEKPAVAVYRKLLHEMAGLNRRWKLHTAVAMMPDDPDGVWSECCDGYGDNVHADVDEVAELCRAYQAMARARGEALR